MQNRFIHFLLGVLSTLAYCHLMPNTHAIHLSRGLGIAPRLGALHQRVQEGRQALDDGALRVVVRQEEHPAAFRRPPRPPATPPLGREGSVREQSTNQGSGPGMEFCRNRFYFLWFVSFAVTSLTKQKKFCCPGTKKRTTTKNLDKRTTSRKIILDHC